MKPKNIETNYGKFPTLTHFERYWEDKVSQSFRDGFKEYRLGEIDLTIKDIDAVLYQLMETTDSEIQFGKAIRILTFWKQRLVEKVKETKR